MQLYDHVVFYLPKNRAKSRSVILLGLVQKVSLGFLWDVTENPNKL